MRSALRTGVALLALAAMGAPLRGVGSDPVWGRRAGDARQVSSGIAAAIRTRLDDPRASGALTPAERSELQVFYAAGDGTPVWVDGVGPNRDAREALALLEASSAHGLEPAAYGMPRLRDLAAALAADGEPSAVNAAAFDVWLSAGMLRYLRHLHLGRVDPVALGFNLRVPDEPHDDFPRLLRAALAEGRLAETADAVSPHLPQYRALRDALGRYRMLASRAPFEILPAPRESVRAGEAYAGLASLRARLVMLGDLSADAPSPGGVYAGSIVEGVRRFQARHGLDDSGVLTPATRAALDVPLSWRTRQIELALERLRWLPDLQGRRAILVNIPMFHLWAWEAVDDRSVPAFDSRAIVGRAMDTRTPVFAEALRSVIFRPYWNVPPNILRREIIPALEREPGYLARHDMEIVRGLGDDAPRVPVTADALAELRQGTLRVRQRPGPSNALGPVKFVFPNAANVYMHGTPAVELFSSARRDFSHGCVRVEDAIGLAAWVLNDQPQWTREDIVAATAGQWSRTVDLTRPVTVVLFYATAMVMPHDGTLHFAEDIYGHDGTLDEALAGDRAAVADRSPGGPVRARPVAP